MKKHFIAPAVALSAIVMALTACNPSTPDPDRSESSETSQVGSSSPGDVSSGGSDSVPVAVGAYEFVDSSYDERREILGKLEKYAVDHSLTGLPLYEDSGYSLYNPRVVKGTDTYIPGYGFSILRDG